MSDQSNETRLVVINGRHGGFSLSAHAVARLRELGHDGALDEDLARSYGGYLRDIDRDDPLLIQVVQELGAEANGSLALLCIVEIPAEVDYTIEEYDGLEHT